MPTTDKLTNEQKVAVLKKVFSEDIEAFGTFFFPQHLKKKTPPFHKEILQLFQADIPRLAIGAPRGHSKSTLTDLVYLAWVIVHDKAKFILLVSDTYSQAVLFLEGLKAEFESNDLLKSFYGNLMSNNWSEGEIVSRKTMVKALGAGMKVRGLKFRESRPDLVIVDDLENDELVENKDRREKLERWYNGALIPAIEGRVIVIGTILHYDSLLSKILSPNQYKEYTKRVYRAIMDGKALWPEHKSLEQIEKLKQEYIEKGQGYLFYQEYMNDPVTEENRKFPLEKFKFYESVEGKQVATYITIDRAYSKQATADATGITVVSVDKENNWYVRQAERFKGTEKELIEKIFDLKGYYSPVKIGIEQKAFEYTIKPSLDDEMRRRNTFFEVVELKDNGNSKIRRIEGLVPRFLSGSIYFLRDQTDLQDELLKFPRATHDDLSDALAYMNEIAKAPAAITNIFGNTTKPAYI